MLTQVDIKDPQGVTLALPLQDTSGGYIIKEIDGLNPVKATLISSNFATLEGSQYQASHRENRNIVLKIGLEPDYASTSVFNLRNQLYPFLMPKSVVSLDFYIDGGKIATITGRVETFDAPIFSKDPEVIVSIVCFDPDLIAVESVILTGSTTDTTVEDPYVYSGSVETGIIFKLFVDRSLSEFMLRSRLTGGVFQTLEVQYALVAGDVVTVDTTPGNKKLILTRSGLDTEILYSISPLSNWVKFLPGTNLFRVSATGLPIPYEIEYYPRYGGL